MEPFHHLSRASLCIAELFATLGEPTTTYPNESASQLGQKQKNANFQWLPAAIGDARLSSATSSWSGYNPNRTTGHVATLGAPCSCYFVCFVFMSCVCVCIEKWGLYDQFPARELRSEPFLFIFGFGPRPVLGPSCRGNSMLSFVAFICFTCSLKRRFSASFLIVL